LLLFLYGQSISSNCPRGISRLTTEHVSSLPILIKINTQELYDIHIHVAHGISLAERALIVGSPNWPAIKTRHDILLTTGKLERQSYMRRHRSYKGSAEISEIPLLFWHHVSPKASSSLQLPTLHTKITKQETAEAHIVVFAGAPIAWTSKKQSVVSPSSTVAEFCASDIAIMHALRVKELHTRCIRRLIPLYANSIVTSKSKALPGRL
jgi:hypothetical protein